MDLSLVIKLRTRIQALIQAHPFLQWIASGLLGAILAITPFRSWSDGKWGTLMRPSKKQEDIEPGLFKKHSVYESFTTPSSVTYPQIRVFYHAHSQAAKLPKDIPLLVFMHGLGGNATQFSPLLTSMINIAPCLAIDLPGCGLSALKPKDSSAYTPYAFAELLYSAIDRYRDKQSDQKVIIIGHSMGCAISTLLVSSTSPLAHFLDKTAIGMISINPRSSPLKPEEALTIQRLKYMPVALFDLFRLVDRRGGLNSESINRVVGKGAEEETRRLQAKFNSMSKSAAFLRIIIGSLSKADGGLSNGWPSEEIWRGIKLPLFLIAGESDHLTPPSEVEQIAKWLTQPKKTDMAKDAKVTSNGILSPAISEELSKSVSATASDTPIAETQLSSSGLPSQPDAPASDAMTVAEASHSTNHALTLKTTIFPTPAAHGLMYATATVRILSGLIETFVAHHIDARLSLGWQLQHLTTSGKWDVKNLKKWQSIAPCSEPIADVFRAMKTMREVDDEHCPKEFVQRFGQGEGRVAIVVDISHESPVYNPQGLEEGRIEYHKFPTVSKLPPAADEVEHFISLIDELRRSPKIQTTLNKSFTKPTIGIHCHYGFNRTGFFIVCYMVERLGYRLQDAVDEFARKREPGIKHEHFLNVLFVRYAVQMVRRGTIVGGGGN